MAISFSRPVNSPPHRRQAPAGSAPSHQPLSQAAPQQPLLSLQALSPASQRLLFSLVELHQILQSIQAAGAHSTDEVDSGAQPWYETSIDTPSLDLEQQEQQPAMSSVKNLRQEDAGEVTRPDSCPRSCTPDLISAAVSRDNIAPSTLGHETVSGDCVLSGGLTTRPETPAACGAEQGGLLPDIVLSCLGPPRHRAARSPDVLSRQPRVTRRATSRQVTSRATSRQVTSRATSRQVTSRATSRQVTCRATSRQVTSRATRQVSCWDPVQPNCHSSQSSFGQRAAGGISTTEAWDERRKEETDGRDGERKADEAKRMELRGWSMVGARLKAIADGFEDRPQGPARQLQGFRTSRGEARCGGGRPLSGWSVPLQLVTRLALIVVVKKITDMLQ
jgi:hypothetical protein